MAKSVEGRRYLLSILSWKKRIAAEPTEYHIQHK